MKHRLDRVNEVMKRELGDLLRREFTFPAQLVTVQQVDITPDLKQAHVYIGVIGSLEAQRATMAQLHDKRTALQHELAKRVILKFTPQLHFTLDDSVERGTRILSILEELHIPDEPKAGSDEDELPASDDDKYTLKDEDEPMADDDSSAQEDDEEQEKRGRGKRRGS